MFKFLLKLFNINAQYPYPRAYSVVDVPPYAYPGAPYALYGVQHGQTTNLGTQMVNHDLMYPAKMFPQFASPLVPS